jgi:hypothetical protein
MIDLAYNNVSQLVQNSIRKLLSETAFSKSLFSAQNVDYNDVGETEDKRHSINNYEVVVGTDGLINRKMTTNANEEGLMRTEFNLVGEDQINLRIEGRSLKEEPMTLYGRAYGNERETEE